MPGADPHVPHILWTEYEENWDDRLCQGCHWVHTIPGKPKNLPKSLAKEEVSGWTFGFGKRGLLENQRRKIHYASPVFSGKLAKNPSSKKLTLLLQSVLDVSRALHV